MIKLFSLKKEQKEAKEQGGPKKTVPGQIRVQRDMADLSTGKTMKIDLYNGPEDLMNFRVIIVPDEGYYKDGHFTFNVKVPEMYPHDPPKVKCEQKIYHPNIDYEGNVCLNILREEWKPVLSINSVIYGLQFLFLEPNPSDPLNKDAAQLLKENASSFSQNVQRAMKGGSVGGVSFDKVV
eukprot:GFYU01001646.1.p1 GENE.GFYU01001646.1~~GFYU01001646.1.p1  ORF type:complete len:191 (-),score=43.21 GFYU01001646.1:581-1120(-)